MIPWYVQAASYIAVVVILVFRLLPRLLEAMLWDGDYYESDEDPAVLMGWANENG